MKPVIEKKTTGLKLYEFKQPMSLAVIAGVLATLVSLGIPNEYVSEARILPKDPKTGAGVGGGIGSMLAATVGFSGLSGMSDSATAYQDILKSRWMADRLLDCHYDYHERTWYFGALVEKKGTLLNYIEAKNRDAAFRYLRSILMVDKDIKSGLLMIRVKTTSQDLSQKIAKNAIRSLEEFINKNSSNQKSAKAEYAHERMKEAEAELNQVDEKLGKFIVLNRNYSTSNDPRVRLAGQRLESERTLRMQVFSMVSMAREQALLEEKDDVSIVNVLDGGHFPEEKTAPRRSLLVLTAFSLGGGLSLAWKKREEMKAYLVDSKGDDHSSG
jgi:capsule polysaccharide export protein KpsE/RkpR